MILTYMIVIDETLKLTQGQGQKVKGQGHIYAFKICVCFAYKSSTIAPIDMKLAVVVRCS